MLCARGCVGVDVHAYVWIQVCVCVSLRVCVGEDGWQY